MANTGSDLMERRFYDGRHHLVIDLTPPHALFLPSKVKILHDDYLRLADA